MRTFHTRLAAGALAAGLALTLTSCGQAAELAAEQAAEQAIGGDVDFQSLHRWLNSTFLASACLSVVRAAARGGGPCGWSSP